jgi:hypothetical protein
MHLRTCILQQSARDIAFRAEVLFTDESCFTRIRITNIHNENMWPDENAHATLSHQQRQISNNSRADILSDSLTDLQILQARLSGRR